jgi:hypothetical protein
MSTLALICIEWGEDGVRKWKRKTPEFKKQALERMQEAKDIGLLVTPVADLPTISAIEILRPNATCPPISCNSSKDICNSSKKYVIHQKQI